MPVVKRGVHWLNDGPRPRFNTKSAARKLVAALWFVGAPHSGLPKQHFERVGIINPRKG